MENAASPLPSTPTPAPHGAGSTAGVEIRGSDAQAAKPAAESTAEARAKEFGGNPGGKPRRDGHAPGSEAAKEADRERERLKKQRQRAQARANNPPVLPSALPSKGSSALGPASASGGAQAPDGGSEVLPMVAWLPDDLRELIEELIPGAEQILVQRLTTRAAAAKLSAELLKDIEQGARWDPVTKKSLSVALPRLIAKWLNKWGISAEWKEEIICSIAGLKILRTQMRLESKLDKIIAQHEAKEKQKEAA
jgi:hypothetical protein